MVTRFLRCKDTLFFHNGQPGGEKTPFLPSLPAPCRRGRFCHVAKCLYFCSTKPIQHGEDSYRRYGVQQLGVEPGAGGPVPAGGALFFAAHAFRAGAALRRDVPSALRRRQSQGPWREEDRHLVVPGVRHGPVGARGDGQHRGCGHGHRLRRAWGHRVDVDNSFLRGRQRLRGGHAGTDIQGGPQRAVSRRPGLLHRERAPQPLLRVAVRRARRRGLRRVPAADTRQQHSAELLRDLRGGAVGGGRRGGHAAGAGGDGRREAHSQRGAGRGPGHGHGVHHPRRRGAGSQLAGGARRAHADAARRRGRQRGGRRPAGQHDSVGREARHLQQRSRPGHGPCWCAPPQP